MTHPDHGLPPPIDAKAPRKRLRPVVRIVLWSAATILSIVGLSFIVLVTWAWRGVGEQEQAEIEGTAFAAEATDEACLNETIRRVRESGSWLVLADAAFLRSCLQEGEASSQFCEGVPLPSDHEAGTEWRMKRCAVLNLDLDESNCSSLFWPIQNYCVERTAAARESQ